MNQIIYLKKFPQFNQLYKIHYKNVSFYFGGRNMDTEYKKTGDFKVKEVFNENGKDIKQILKEVFSAYFVEEATKQKSSQTFITDPQVTDIVIKQVKKRCKDFIIEQEYCKTGWSLTSKINSRKNIINNEIALLKKQLNDWNQKIDKIYDDKVSSLITEEDFKRLYIKFIENRDATQKSIEELEMSNDEKEKVVDVIKIVKNFLKMKEITRTMLVQLVDKVTINEQKEITIYYKFKLLNMKAIKNNEEEIVNQNIC